MEIARSSLGSTLVRVCAIALAAVPWLFVARTLAGAHPVHGEAQATAVVWGDRVFASPSSLSQWLRSKGVSYSLWTDRHPGAAGILVGKRPASTSAKQAPSGPPPPRQAERRAAPANGSSATNTGPSALAIDLMLAAAVLFAGLSLCPPRVARLAPIWLGPVLARRALLGYSALAMLLGMAVSAVV